MRGCLLCCSCACVRLQIESFRFHMMREHSLTFSWSTRSLKAFPALKGSRAPPASIREPKPLRKWTYHWQEDVEDLEGYHEGGYHPVHIQDELSNGRYHAMHKLGFGNYSTASLAKDLHMNRYVAIEIIATQASKTSSEGQILRHLRDAPTNLPGRSYVSSL